MKSHRGEKAQFLEEALPHMASLYRFSVSLTRDEMAAEDLVQETYKEAWKSFGRYTPGSDCKAWLFRILFRVWGKQRRRDMKMKQIDIQEVPESQLSQAPDFQERLERKEVLKILHSLPEHYQTVLILADVEQFRYHEIAQMLNLPVGTVMSRLNRARSLLRRKLTGEATRWRSA